ncbi:MAG: protein kinase [Polyangiaceae bacterium]|nr:protein kinase [Polyangiaceae bacterium]
MPSTASTPKSADKNIGKVIAGRYKIETRIGEGGMGVVYRARHVLIDRVVALKLIRPDLRGETHLRVWMLREARAANRVDHAHIVDIHDIGETEEGELYLVMEYLVGLSLSSEIARGPFPMVRAVDILEQMCAALARAHDLGVVHRDLKSDNIMLTVKGGRKDSVKILDFGLASLTRDPRLAPKGAVFGTPEYMSPEQARGEEAGPKSDLYAIGVLFFEMACGQLPFKSPDRDTLLEMQRSALPPRPRQLRPELAPAAESIIYRLLEKDPRKRFLDAHHLQEELKALQRALPSRNWDMAAGGTEGAPAVPPPPPPPQSEGVTEWANRAALFSRMVARAYHQGNAPREIEECVDKAWDLAAKASRLEGEVSTHSTKLESLEKRGRALRAEIGRKVEELAHEESRVLREVAGQQEEIERITSEMRSASREASAAKHAADNAEKNKVFDRAVFERAGGLAAKISTLREQADKIQNTLAARELVAKDLRKQIEELRNQLARYADALEEDLAAGREKVATRTREGLTFEKTFAEVSNILITHLKNKPEVRDLMAELLHQQPEQSKHHDAR